MRPKYDYRNCQSLFGYAQQTHQRSRAVCQLCGCDAGSPINFDLWRQMTVEHLISESQRGYSPELRSAVAERFPHLSAQEQARLVKQIDEANTVTTCRFCNSTTSRDRHSKDMRALLREAEGTPDQVIAAVVAELKQILGRKRADVQWKLESVRAAFEDQIVPRLRQ